MRINRLLVYVLLTCYACSTAQMMNVKKWRATERDSLDNALLLIDEKFYLQALPIFEKILARHPQEEFLKYSYAKCALYRDDKHGDAYIYLTEVYLKNKKMPEVQYEMAQAAHYNYRFDEALNYLNIYLGGKHINSSDKENAARLSSYIKNAKYFYAHPTGAKITNLGKIINSADEEYRPVITADESALIYTYAGARSKGGLQNATLQTDITHDVYMEDIYMSFKQDNLFKTPISLDSLNTAAPEAAIAISNDGGKLFVYQEAGDGHGDIYQSVLKGGNFTKPKRLKGEVNSYSWDGHCSLSPDGQTLYFSSERPGGRGGRDIYKASFSAADTAWVNAVNLGDSVNTPYDEDAPFIHPDGCTLFYSSKGRNSMGDYDVFKTTMDPDSTFKKIENLGYPINSPADDIYFVLSANGKNGYYSSGRKDGKGLKDIYLVEPNFKGLKPALYLVKGKIKSNGVAVEALIKTEMISKNNQFFSSVTSKAASGAYLVCLPAGADYKLTYYFKNQPPRALVVNAGNLKVFVESIRDVNFDFKIDTAKALASQTPLVLNAPIKPQKDGFVPRNKVHEKTIRYAERYGEIGATGLEFVVQISAFKLNRKYYFPNLQKFGKLQKMELGDGFTRLMIGGSFKTLKKALAMNKKVVNAGQEDAFVVVLYMGKRVQLEELEKIGVFK